MKLSTAIVYFACIATAQAKKSKKSKTRDKKFTVYMDWEGAIIDNGLEGKPGEVWSFVGDLTKERNGGTTVGKGREYCTRLDDSFLYCTGTFVDLNDDYAGQITFAGPFEFAGLNEGRYTINGGTGDFAGVCGYVHETYDEDDFVATREVVIEKC
jgi:hypothetical protein